MHSKKEKKKQISKQSFFNRFAVSPFYFHNTFTVCPATRYSIQREIWCTGPYAGVYYNLTLCRLQSRIHIYLEYHSVCPLVRIGTPHPFSYGRVCPPEPKRGRAHSPAMEGWVTPNADDWRKILALSLPCGRLQHMYHGPSYARVDLELTLCQSRLYPQSETKNLASVSFTCIRNPVCQIFCQVPEYIVSQTLTEGTIFNINIFGLHYERKCKVLNGSVRTGKN
jgi:hypothetical protein